MEDIKTSCSAAGAAPLFPRRGTYRELPVPSAVNFFLVDLSDDGPRHFLDSCFLCKKPLASNSDIFMYRGDIPFCSEECREEQIDMDEEREKNRKIAMKKALNHKKSSSSPEPKTIHVRACTVVAG
ncbi:hypothetical protein KSP40_PGU015214 [Platanthera guangdongensis]|uniref:FLZ-type domain-containing protein n=1 Tax=Platanthera guangdongensis TaxID=2320717 RepID=A0ABR2LPE5_9ASPA